VSKFQRRHYEALADALNEARRNTAKADSEDAQYGFWLTVGAIQNMFEHDNNQFDSYRFLKRIGEGSYVD